MADKLNNVSWSKDPKLFSSMNFNGFLTKFLEENAGHTANAHVSVSAKEMSRMNHWNIPYSVVV